MTREKAGEPRRVRQADGATDRKGPLEPIRRLIGSVLALPPVVRLRAILRAYDDAGGGLLAAGLAYAALFAGLTGLLFGVGILGYLVPADADRQRLVSGFTGQLAPLAPIAKDGLADAAAHAGAFSIVGLAGMAWGTSQFYGSLDRAIARVFDRAPARGALDRLLRGFVSVLLLVGGIVSGIAISAIQAVVASAVSSGPEGTRPARYRPWASPSLRWSWSSPRSAFCIGSSRTHTCRCGPSVCRPSWPDSC